MNMLTCPKCNASKRNIKKKPYRGGCLDQLFLLGAALTPIIGWAWIILFWKPQYQYICKDCKAEWLAT